MNNLPDIYDVFMFKAEQNSDLSQGSLNGIIISIIVRSLCKKIIWPKLSEVTIGDLRSLSQQEKSASFRWPDENSDHEEAWKWNLRRKLKSCFLGLFPEHKIVRFLKKI